MKKVIMFDFDGVIVDSFELNLTTRKLTHPETSPDEYRERFKGNIYSSHKETENPLENENVINFFAAYTPGLMALECVPGIAKVIEQLAQSHDLIIVSSTIEDPIRSFLEKHEIKQYFSEVYGLETDRNKTKKIRMAMDKYRVSADECLFITDTLGDIKEAEKAGVKSVAVSWGFHFKEMLAEGQPLAIAETPEQLLDLISK